ncbi:hypothetical protein IAU60_004008 [Kwoniella sp. DSM 27419]
MSSAGPSRGSTIPSHLSTTYWSTWHPIRHGASVIESLERSEGEEWIGGWDAVGLYHGNETKIPSYQTLSIHLTTHRLILVPEPVSTDRAVSLQTRLAYVRQTELYAGFMRSSPKITLTLGMPTPSRDAQPQGQAQASSSTAASAEAAGWTCRVCGYVNNTTGGLGTVSSKCGLCGVPYSTSQQSASGPPSRSATPTVPAPETATRPAQTLAGAGTKGDTTMIGCPACTFLNSPYLPNCEICSTPLPESRARGRAQDNTSGGAKSEVVRLSFRKGGVQEAYKKLKSVLSDKAWERVPGGTRDRAEAKSDVGVDGTPEAGTPSRPGAGIDGILQTMDLNARSQDAHMQSAFADLDALMLRAGEMVRLAQSLNTKLTQAQQSSAPGSQPTEEEATMIRTSLVQLGLAAPALTQDMVRDEKRYHEGLARELGELLTGRAGREEGLMVGQAGRGVLGLDEVWGLWMRARGVSLLSPATLIAILPYLPANTQPSIQSLVLPSSLHVLYTPSYSTPSILSRTLDRLSPSDTRDALSLETQPAPRTEESFSILEFASIESIPIGLAKEFIDLMEKEGGLVRDDQAPASEGGVRWYRDLIQAWPV